MFEIVLGLGLVCELVCSYEKMWVKKVIVVFWIGCFIMLSLIE